MKHAAPFVFAFVLTLAFLLMLITFRSVVIAIKAVLLNLLSVAAAYGALVLVFQNGWGKGLLGFVPPGGIISWLPIFLFVILFGLSMDYHVFILSRIREAFDRGMTTDDAVTHGIKATAGVVTSAALVMFGVFSIFATLQFMFLKEFGVGLAVAVLVDATIVRAVLLPAIDEAARRLELVPAQVARVAARLSTTARRPSRSHRRARSRRLLPSRRDLDACPPRPAPCSRGRADPPNPDNREAVMTIAELHEHVNIASPPASAAVRLTSVSRVYGSGHNKVAALRELRLALTKGSFTAVMGPSGSGKSTFLHCAAGLDRPTSGSIHLADVDLAQLERRRS